MASLSLSNLFIIFIYLLYLILSQASKEYYLPFDDYWLPSDYLIQPLIIIIISNQVIFILRILCDF